MTDRNLRYPDVQFANHSTQQKEVVTIWKEKTHHEKIRRLESDQVHSHNMVRGCLDRTG